MRVAPSRFWTAGVFVLTLAGVSIVCQQMYAGDLSGASWVAPARASRKHNPIAPDTASIRAGHAVYCDQCLCCHGSAGKGDGSSASDMTPKPVDLTTTTQRAQTDGALFWKITNGRDPMPGFDNMIAAKDRWNVINYLRTLEPKPTTVASSTRQSEEASNN